MRNSDSIATDLSGWKVLIIDNSTEATAVACNALLHRGAKVLTVTSSEDALNFLRHVQPSIIIIELALRNIDGWQLLGQIRTRPQLATIPTVAMTAHHSINLPADTLKAGFNAYLAKPFDESSLVSVLLPLKE